MPVHLRDFARVLVRLALAIASTFAVASPEVDRGAAWLAQQPQANGSVRRNDFIATDHASGPANVLRFAERDRGSLRGCEMTRK